MANLLVVDDNEQNRCLLQTLLLRHGYDVILASDGAEAIAKARDDPPDLVITDILMPGMDGYALCRQWKRDETLNKIPFVFYTATYTDPKDEQFALGLGAERFIRKPQEQEAFVNMIEEVIEEHKAGKLTPPREPVLEENVYLKEYNEALVRKLQDKLVELESAKASLEREAAERRRGDHDILASETRYRRLFESAKDGILILNADTGQIVDVNPFLVDLLGYGHEDFLGKKLWEIGLFKDIAASEAAFLELQEKKYVRYEDLPLKTRDGRKIEVEFVSNVYLVDSTKVIQCNIRDITKHRQLEEQYRQAQKMEAVGQLAGGVAHDFNNILQAIVGYSSMLLERLPEHEEAHGFAEEIARGAERAAALTRQLLAFSRRQILKMEDLDLSEVVRGLMKMIRRIIGEDIDVDIKEGHRLGIVHADRGQMEQVLLNLCINARDAMPEGGTLSIKVENVAMDSEYCETHAWASPGRYVLLSISDSGCGMGAETQAHIFEPFFTTKELGKGTGLGLATVYGIVKQHQGLIHVYSEAGKGTILKVYLPSLERAAESVETEEAGRAQGSVETILVAEDDETLRKLAARILESAGYTVLLASNGEEALDVYEKHAVDIDLFLLDVIMPKMGGKAVYDVIRPNHPHLRFLFSSGYSTNVIHTGFVLKAGIELIEKPYAPDALLRKVRQVLDDVGPNSESKHLDRPIVSDLEIGTATEETLRVKDAAPTNREKNGGMSPVGHTSSLNS